jgi:hypothetical protein
MYERTYGAKYAETGGQTTAQIAAMIRADIKAAVNVGTLPGKPVKYSVRTDNFSGGSSIDVRVKDWPEAWQECTGIIPGSEDGYTARDCRNMWCAGHYEMRDNPNVEHHKVLTVEGQRVQKVLEVIHRAYNHDGSEILTDYFDVRFYGQVNIDREW